MTLAFAEGRLHWLPLSIDYETLKHYHVKQALP
jgi:hypothetical protein